jgi:hypothetical protein
MRNISFSLTTPQFLAQSKDVTRRLEWLNLKVGERLMGCEKCMGRKAGEPLVRLGPIEAVNVRREPLMRMTQDPFYGASECRREGFPEMKPWQFVQFFCDSHLGCSPATTITRIEFIYLPFMPGINPTDLIGLKATFDGPNGKRLTGIITAAKDNGLTKRGAIPDFLVTVRGESGATLEVSLVESHMSLPDR